MSSPDVIKYQDPKSILVVNERGQIRQLFCPFKVQCIEAVENIPVHALLYVEAVFVHKKYVLLYWIHQKPYAYHYFRVLVTW